MDLSDLRGSIKAAVDINPWRAAAFAAAGAALFVLNAWGALPLPAWALTIIGVITVVANAIALIDLVKAIVFAIGATIRWLGERRALRRAQARVLRHLDTLTPREREIFGFLLARNQRNFDGAVDGGYAQGLIANGLVHRPGQVGNAMHTAYIIPEFVWQALKRREADFPDTYQGQADPWRRPWAV